MQTNIGSTTSYFVGNYYQVENGVVTKYYYAGTQRIAMRKNGTLTYILGDHLGSTSLVIDANGAVINETKYKAWGETCYSSGAEQTKYTYTGQYSYVSDFGLHFYNARWYDSSLSRFAQADTIVPRGAQGYDRYAYTNNNPINYTDPSGHDAWWATSPEQAENYYDSIVTPSNPAPTMSGGVVCGSIPDFGMTSPGANCPGSHIVGEPGYPGHMTNWNQESAPSGVNFFYVQYPGDSNPNDNNPNDSKLRQSSAIGTGNPHPQLPLLLICYSAGVDSCLLYAKDMLALGNPPEMMVLLGGGYEAYVDNSGNTMTFYANANGQSGGFAQILTDLYYADTDILIVNDADAVIRNDPAVNFMLTGNANANFTNIPVPEPHWIPGISIDNSDNVRDIVNNWILENR